MADHSKILAFIEQSTDRSKLRTLIERAREQNVPEVENAAFRRLVSIVPEVEPGTLEHDFWQTIHAFEQLLGEERGRTTLLSRTRQKVGRVGVVETLQDWALGKQTEGFEMLMERGMPELTGEAVIVRHADRFSGEIVASARSRLLDAGYDPAGLSAPPFGG